MGMEQDKKGFMRIIYFSINLLYGYGTKNACLQALSEEVSISYMGMEQKIKNETDKQVTVSISYMGMEQIQMKENDFRTPSINLLYGYGTQYENQWQQRTLCINLLYGYGTKI